MPSTDTSRSSSPSPTRQQPTEVTNLLPPSSSSRPHTPSVPHHHHHNRKASLGGRSVNGSVRGYGATPGPVDQAPRVSKKGQRRILTTFPLQLVFFTLVILTFLSFVLTIILFLNTALDLTGIAIPYRGSGFVEFWISVVGSWIGLGGVIFFSHPSVLFFITTLITFLLHIPVILLVVLCPPLKSAHLPLFLVPLILTAVTLTFSLLSNYLVRRARFKESQRIVRMLTDAAGRERSNEEATVRAMVGMQGKGVWGRFVAFVSAIAGLIAGLAGAILVALLLIDLSISAYDQGSPLPSLSSKMIIVNPPPSPWPISVHIGCTGPRNSTHSSDPGALASLPTILYESPSGVPGSLALLDIPLPPGSEDAENPGRWLFELQKRREVGRVCTWDRPGYGFSEVMSDANLGGVADALWLALDGAGETVHLGTKFLLVGEGYGGLVTRVVASRRPELIHSLLHIDAQTAQTYFNEAPRGLSVPSLALHRVATRLLPSLLTPLSFARLPSVLLRRSSSLSRILASSHPAPSTVRLSENLQKARLQETFGAHSHTSSSFRALLESGREYPAARPAIVLSSLKMMEEDEEWAEGQRGLAEEVTAEEGLVSWEKVEGVDHWVCEGEGKAVCENAVKRLLKA